MEGPGDGRSSSSPNRNPPASAPWEHASLGVTCPAVQPGAPPSVCGPARTGLAAPGHAQRRTHGLLRVGQVERPECAAPALVEPTSHHQTVPVDAQPQAGTCRAGGKPCRARGEQPDIEGARQATPLPVASQEDTPLPVPEGIQSVMVDGGVSCSSRRSRCGACLLYTSPS